MVPSFSTTNPSKIYVNENIIEDTSYYQNIVDTTDQKILKFSYNVVAAKQTLNLVWENLNSVKLGIPKSSEDSEGSFSIFCVASDSVVIRSNIGKIESWYFNDTYKTVSNFGGNANSIGIEMESQKGTDFYLNMQRTAKLVAMLMDKYNLTTNDVKMHNYFSGKNCPQTMREANRWETFLELCKAENDMYKYFKNWTIEFDCDSDLDDLFVGDYIKSITFYRNSECIHYSGYVNSINQDTKSVILELVDFNEKKY